MIGKPDLIVLTNGEVLVIVYGKYGEMLYSLTFIDNKPIEPTLISRTSNEKGEDGPISSATFQSFRGLVRSQNDDMVFVADSNNVRVIYCLKSGK